MAKSRDLAICNRTTKEHARTTTGNNVITIQNRYKIKDMTTTAEQIHYNYTTTRVRFLYTNIQFVIIFV